MKLKLISHGVRKRPGIKPYWRIIVDDRTQLKFSDFFNTQDAIVDPTAELLHSWRQDGINISYISGGR